MAGAAPPPPPRARLRTPPVPRGAPVVAAGGDPLLLRVDVQRAHRHLMPAQRRRRRAGADAVYRHAPVDAPDARHAARDGQPKSACTGRAESGLRSSTT
eukprot:gene4501-biopygen11723